MDARLASPGRRLPIGLLVVTASGSLLLGIVVALAGLAFLPEPIAIMLGAGLLGGYTTFSAASLETVRLIAARRWGAALVTGPGMLVLCVALAAIGITTTSAVAAGLAA